MRLSTSCGSAAGASGNLQTGSWIPCENVSSKHQT